MATLLAANELGQQLTTYDHVFCSFKPCKYNHVLLTKSPLPCTGLLSSAALVQQRNSFRRSIPFQYSCLCCSALHCCLNHVSLLSCAGDVIPHSYCFSPLSGCIHLLRSVCIGHVTLLIQATSAQQAPTEPAKLQMALPAPTLQPRWDWAATQTCKG